MFFSHKNTPELPHSDKKRTKQNKIFSAGEKKRIPARQNDVSGNACEKRRTAWITEPTAIGAS